MARGSLKYQIIMDLDPLQRYGESKHKAKMEEKARCEREGIKWNPARVEGIYSIATYDKYKDINIKFGEWAKEEFGVRHIEQLKNLDLIKKYLEFRQQSGDSPYSLQLYGSAIAKMMRCQSNEFGFTFPARTREAITRSREARYHDKEFSAEKNKDIIDFGKATGLRRRELSLLKPGQIQKDQNGQVIIEIDKSKYGAQSKGGRSRITMVLESGKEHVWNMRQKAIEEGRSTVFVKIPNRLDEHSLRREYAKDCYSEIVGKKGHEAKDYIARDGTGRRFDKEILREVSENLGHSRIAVMVKHYMD